MLKFYLHRNVLIYLHINIKFNVQIFRNIYNATTVIAKITEKPRSLFYDIPCFVTMGFEKLYISLLVAQCKEICAFEILNHVDYMQKSRLRYVLTMVSKCV